MKIAQRGQISPFHVMEVMMEAQALADQGRDVIHLSVGQPCMEAPEAVRRYAAELLTSGAMMGYTDTKGVFLLRQKIAEFYRKRYDVEVPVERIIITVGSSAGLFVSLISAFDVGDKVALSVPYYPAYPNMLEAAGIKPLYMRTDTGTNYQPTLAMLKALPEKPDGLIIGSPSNPAGTIIDPVELDHIVAYCRKQNIRLISDEIYHGITYDAYKAETLAAKSKDAIIINSFSKYFLMPGWRLGWTIVPEELLRSFESLLQNFFICPPAISQHAAIKIFDCLDELDGVVANYTHNRALLLEALPQIGFDKLSPSHGGFYLYADVSNFTSDSDTFCRTILKETGVSLVPGHDFDSEQGSRFIRFSFSGDQSRIEEAVKRLQRWLK